MLTVMTLVPLTPVALLPSGDTTSQVPGLDAAELTVKGMEPELDVSVSDWNGGFAPPTWKKKFSAPVGDTVSVGAPLRTKVTGMEKLPAEEVMLIWPFKVPEVRPPTF